MKRILSAIAFVASASMPALADTQETTSTATGTGTGISDATAIVLLDQSTAAQPKNVTYTNTGTTKIKNTPGLGGIALGGGHPCASSPMGLQVVLPGAGGGVGGQQIDDGCMFLIAAAASGDSRYYDAFNYLTASADMDTCNAMLKALIVSECLTAAQARKRRVVAQPTVSSRSVPVAFASARDLERNNR